MLQALIITLREGVEAALIVGITLAYLNKIGRPELRRSVFLALGAAFLASLVGAVVLARMQINQEVFEGWVMLAAAFFVVTMIVFMMRTARHLKGHLEGRIGTLADKGSPVGLFLFVFLMVLREGVETVLILSAVSLNSTELLSVLGTLVGVAVAVVFGVMFVKGSVRINLQRFFKVTTVILVFVAAQLVVSGLHELSENGVLPSSRREMAVIGPIVRNDMFFFVTILALAALMMLFEYRRRVPEAAAAESRAAERKQQWRARRERLWIASVYASSFLFILLVTAEFIYAKTTNALPPSTELTLVNDQATIPLTQVSDGDLHRFAADLGGTRVRFLVYQRPDGKYATVADACEICGGVGFAKGANGIICKNCAAPIAPSSMGQPGGCNPVPVKASVAGGSLVISRTDLAAVAPHFSGHK
ncbi:MAG: DUF2318 domain-containing protein [Candidatus Koribacter versatilis]|uniref:DUF2318 domain-containing protein n=1 Tax=Candidatus Korobacter versatilis TaxID=658062 RepID=A0A932ENP3_9BACT|nr:DUF2318 domain-containing protein [Candidatus Koribacter versatilis]